MTENKYKYRREDFGELPVRLDHMTMSIKFFEDRVEAENCLEMTARRDIEKIALDARDLTVHSVEWYEGSDEFKANSRPVTYDYARKKK